MRRRFVAPLRGSVADAVFAHPIYAGYRRFDHWMRSGDWPTPQQLTPPLQAHAATAAMRFVVQDRTLLADGLHYEQRIAEQGVVATRERSWHDLFNAMVWCTYPGIKQALNARQMADIARMGPHQRSRAQSALTHFDEAGVIVQVRDPALLDLWDRHNWHGLFHARRDAWHAGGIAVAAVIGHALLEHALCPDLFVVGKCLVVQGDAASDRCVPAVAAAIAQGRVLVDPLELRPLPLPGIPDWDARNADTAFLASECFRPLRPGRRYPAAMPIG